MIKLRKLIIGLVITLLVTSSAQSFTNFEDYNRPDPLQKSKNMGENFEVGQFTGAAIFDYAIELPESPNGLTPSFKLIFNSQDERFDYQLAYHWDFTEYSIKRFNKFGVEKMYDNNHFIASLPFEQGELIALGASPHGTYGQKVESAFANYEFLPNNTWLVTTKEGVKYEFGTTDEARQFDPEDPSHNYSWYLETVTDANGNTIHYEYRKDYNQLYPKAIYYGANSIENSPYRIEFQPISNSYQNRFRAHTSYAAGFEISTRSVLSEIGIKVNGQLTSQYDLALTYLSELRRDLLGSITRTDYSPDGAPISLPPTRFEYTESEVSWRKTDDYEDIPFILRYCTEDYCVDRNDTVAYWDMTGDAIVDFQHHGPPISARLNQVNQATPDGFGNWSITQATRPYISAGYNGQPVLDYNKRLVDFNGDARLDILRSDHNKGYCGYNGCNPDYISGGVTYHDNRPGATQIDVAIGNHRLNPTGTNYDNGANVLDLNGDGLPDMTQSHLLYPNLFENSACLNQGGEACVSTDLWLLEHPAAIDTYSNQSTRHQTANDCNFDGLGDISGLNDGKGGWATGQLIGFCKPYGRQDQGYHSLDLNADHFPDQVDIHVARQAVRNVPQNWISLGTLNTVTPRYQNVFPLSSIQDLGTYGFAFVDLNADLLPDIIQSQIAWVPYKNAQETQKGVYYHTGSVPYRLKTIYTSTGAQIDLEYKTSGQYFMPDQSRANPALPFLIETVSKVVVDDGLGNETSTDYFYQDGHYYYQDAYDREFAGFGIVIKTDAAGIATKNFYHQSQYSVQRPDLGEFDDHISKKGQIYRVEVLDENGNIKSSTTNKWAYRNLPGGRYFPHALATLNQSHD